MTKTLINGFLVMIVSVFITACGVDDKENPPQAVGPYSFFNATTPITITRSGGSSCTSGSCIDNGISADANTTVIVVQLLKNGIVEPGQTVQMLPFDYKYGFVEELVVTTTTNGYAVFNYQPAENYDAIIGQDITIHAVFLDPEAVLTSSTATAKELLRQDFVLQFR